MIPRPTTDAILLFSKYAQYWGIRNTGVSNVSSIRNTGHLKVSLSIQVSMRRSESDEFLSDPFWLLRYKASPMGAFPKKGYTYWDFESTRDRATSLWERGGSGFVLSFDEDHVDVRNCAPSACNTRLGL